MSFINLLSALSVYFHEKPSEVIKPAPPAQVKPINNLPDIEGWASYYGYESGSVTASGEPFYPGGYTAAHRTLAFGTCLRIEYPATGRDVTVRINDRGPFVPPRILDLSEGAAEAIGLKSAGVGYIKGYKVSCK